jgi:hypothetical protein
MDDSEMQVRVIKKGGSLFAPALTKYFSKPAYKMLREFP